jgi:phosphoribosylamine--glycine ligase
MGAYAPAPAVTAPVAAIVEERIIRPVLDGMAAEGHPYRGVLYAGLMIGSTGPRVVEFNCRLGDPETQAVLPLLECDLLDLFERAAAGTVAGADAPSFKGAAACVVLAAPGYPVRHATGALIQGLSDVPEDVLVFHSGTRVDERLGLVTSGGRVLSVVGRGADLPGALERAYAGADAIHFEGMQLRRDIGRRGLERASAEA